MNIATWLRELDLDRYEPAFRDNDIDSDILGELTADDLIALGLKPGPKFGEILEAAETQQLEGKLRTREEALEWVKREYSLGKES